MMKIKFNKMLLPLLLVLIVAISISAVSAVDVDADTNNTDSSLNDVNVGGNTYTVNDTTDFATIQQTIDNAKSGDTIVFEEGTYGNETNTANFAVSTGIIFKGQGSTIYGGDLTAIFNVKASSTTDITGASFYDFNFIMVGEEKWNGRGIQFNNGKNSIIDNCTFTNGNAGIYSKASSNVTVTNCYFTGVSNSSTIGTKSEVGTKAMNIMGSQGLKIKNCIFEGDLLDGVSIASNSRGVEVINNTFSCNNYGIFFGGGSNGTISQNTFKSIKVNAISMAKSSSQTTVSENTFECLDYSTQIYIEQGNTAHGTPTNIGSIYILNNTFKSTGIPSSVNAVYVFSNGGPLEVQGEFIVKENTLTGGIKLFTFFDNDWGTTSEINISETAKSYYEISANNVTLYYRNGSAYEVTLTDDTGEALASKDIIMNINGAEYTIKTNEKGVASLPIGLPAGTYAVKATFTGKKGTVSVENEITVLSTIKGEDIELYYKNGTSYKVKAVDGNGNPLTQGTVLKLNVNGVMYDCAVNANGEAALPIGLGPGKYTITAINPVNGEMTSNTIIVKSYLEAEDTTVGYRTGSFDVKVLNKANGKPLANATVNININGVIYGCVSNNDGIASLPIGLIPGQYIATAEYDGLMISRTVTVTA